MSIPPMNGNGVPPAGLSDSGQKLIADVMETADVLALKARGSNSAAEAKDFMAAVLSASQVVALLDPAKDVNGVPLAHHAAMQQAKGALELEKVKQQAKAQPPTPGKKTVSVKRDANGRANSYSVEGS